VSSPTFSIVNEYQADENTKIYHFDFYRIEDEKEAYDMGYEEYFFSSAYCFIEWSEKIPNLIEEDMVKIKMSIVGNTRKIEVII
jgi:tRNA threonylcarbamoyladenosine biosynthesis protein TsaE